MTAPASQIQWYLAREGQQYGPLSEGELAKLVELGHLQPNDLLWREGFPDWRPALVVFPQKPKPAPAVKHPPLFDLGGPASPRLGGERPAADRARLEPLTPPEAMPAAEPAEPRRSFADAVRKITVAVILLAAVGAGGWLAYPHRYALLELAGSWVPGGGAGGGTPVDRKSLETPPLAGFKGDAKAIDAAMQEAAVWRIVKREFPDWYAQRLKEIESMSSAGRDDATIGQHLARAMVTLRRQQVDNALAARVSNLKRVATAFLDNIERLRKANADACYNFISQGEPSPVIVGLLQGSEHVVSLQTQMVAVLEAISDGRRSPRVYAPPRQTDYDLLAADLGKRGWTKADMQLFSDERALARAAPDKVCQLVQDWFAAQLAISDGEVQQRLLVDSLRPVVAG